jgi:hypothetical protein
MKKVIIYILLALWLALLTTISAYAITDPCPSNGNGAATKLDIRVDGKKVNDLSTVVGGSTVTIKFMISGSQATQFSLVSYKLPTSPSAMTPGLTSQMVVYQQASLKSSGGGQVSLSILVPDCYYRIYFVKGCVLDQYNAATGNSYETWNRVILTNSGGDHCWKRTPPQKITICHIPPGNPTNAHTISVSINSWPAHQGHSDYLGECHDSLPPDTSECACDYDHDGLVDRLYGSTMYSLDSQYSVHYSAGSDSATVKAFSGTISYVVVYYEDGTTETFSSLSTTTFVIASPGPDILGVEVNGNLIDNLHKLDPDVLCDCYPDIPGEPVPVKLTYLKGEKIAPNIVRIDWQTASEENSDYFLVQRTTDMKDWKEICHVSGAGTSKVPKDYSCTDANANEDGQNLGYYQLKQVDLNGTYEYSDMIRIRLQDANSETHVGDAYPNPTTGRIYISYKAAENGLFTIRLLSIDGKVLLASEFVATTGTQIADLDLGENLLKPGLYILEVKSDKEVFRQKVYKQ